MKVARKKPTPVLKELKTSPLPPPREVLTVRQLTRALEAAKKLQTRNNLLYEALGDSSWKEGHVVVAGMHNNLPSLKIIADIVQPYPVIVLEDPRTTISSVLGGGLKSSAIPRDLPKNTDLRYTTNDTIEEVSALFILADIPLPCINFCSGATILGNVETLRKILQGKKYYPIARGGDLVALELE